jgi:hypothetical protein
MVLLDHDLYTLLDFGQHAMEVASYFRFRHAQLRHRFVFYLVSPIAN